MLQSLATFNESFGKISRKLGLYIRSCVVIAIGFLEFGCPSLVSVTRCLLLRDEVVGCDAVSQSYATFLQTENG